jgi:hypothetical protein
MKGLLVAITVLASSLCGSGALANTKLECELFEVGLEASPSNGTITPLYLATQTEIRMLENVTLTYLQREMTGVRSETFQSFQANNKAAVIVDCAGVKPAGRDVIVTDEELSDHQTRYSISRAGVSADGNQALLYSGYFCGPLCGGGSVFLFERLNGKWAQIGQAMIWIS